MTKVKADKLNMALNCLDGAGALGMSRKEVAHCLGVKVTPYLTNILDTLIEHNYARKALDENVYPFAWRYYYVNAIP